MIEVATPIPIAEDVDPARFVNEIEPAGRPVVMRGLVADWPVVAIASKGAHALADYLRTLDGGEPVSVMHGKPDSGGYYFYDDTMDDFNFKRVSARLPQIIDGLLAAPAHPTPTFIYAGPALGDKGTAAFEELNPLAIVPQVARARLWLSNQSRVAAHYDVARNVACVVAGTRRVTMFPPEQVGNLYMGPFEHTMAGPTVSMVDFHAPDYDRYPRFRQAQAAAMTATLEPGDAIYIPTLWWHHIESFGSFNLLVNHWWKPDHATVDFEALLTAISGLRDQPAPERAAWRAFFDHFVFGDDAPGAGAHLPPKWQTVTGGPSAEREQVMLRFIIGQLSDRLR